MMCSAMFVLAGSIQPFEFGHVGKGCRNKLWPCGRVAVWPCGRVAVWAVWPCGRVAVWPCGRVAVWPCGRGRVARVAGWPGGRVAGVAGWPGGRVAGWPVAVAGWPWRAWPGGRVAGLAGLAGWPGWPWPWPGRGRDGRQLKKAIVTAWKRKFGKQAKHKASTCDVSESKAKTENNDFLKLKMNKIICYL